MAVQIQIRRGTASEWTSADPVLMEGEMGIDTTNNQFRIGDGSTEWSDLGVATGTPGSDGDNAPAVKIEYSADGSTGWSATFTPGTHLYVRFSVNDGSTWTDGMKFVGVDGADGGLTGGTLTGNLDFNDYKAIQPDIKDYVETLATATWDSDTQDIDLEDGNVHSVSITAAVTTLTFDNPRAGAHSFTLIVLQDATVRAITWPDSVAWAGGDAPEMAEDATYWITFATLNGGTNWIGFLAGEVVPEEEE